MGPTFTYNPDPSPPPEPPPPEADGLGLLEGLKGSWAGTGFNAIWRPNRLTTGQDRFLELNSTRETLEFDVLAGGIPNRGLWQPDITMGGPRYLQQILDVNLPATSNGLHVEPGVWLNVPSTTDPPVSPSVVRMASIPHGTTILAQGLPARSQARRPSPPPTSTRSRSATLFQRQRSRSRTSPATRRFGPVKTSPASRRRWSTTVLTAADPGLTMTSTVVLQVSSLELPVPGGGTTNTAFLLGGSDGPNADAASVTATFWLETIEGAPAQLQYSQTVLLNFKRLSWPHVTVASLRPAEAH